VRSSELLEGRVAVVSGVGPGLGRGLAVELAAHGADVVLVARRQEHLDAVAAEVEALGRSALRVTADITDAVACQAVVDRTLERFGRVDTLVNNAHRGGTHHRFLDTFDTDAWRAAMEVNLWGSLTMTHAVARAMVTQGAGSIVMIATMAVRDIQPGQGPYATSKAALVSATRTLARELGPSGVRVNAVLPGYMDGPAVDAWMQSEAATRGGTPDDVRAELVEKIALRFLPEEREVAGTVVWLASDLARPVTGQAVDVNGGQYL
jgi:NAD(P)-dependent dehydrogenase (short-subunit alcohol dehydrogenase family)